MTDETIREIENTINSQDHPGDVWFIDTVQSLVNEVRRLRANCSRDAILGSLQKIAAQPHVKGNWSWLPLGDLATDLAAALGKVSHDR